MHETTLDIGYLAIQSRVETKELRTWTWHSNTASPQPKSGDYNGH